MSSHKLSHIVDVIIPAYNEEKSITKVIDDIPKELVRHIIVCDNNSTDGTGQRAKEVGAKVVFEEQPGYGNACLAGLNYISSMTSHPDVVVFIDGDYSDYPSEMPNILHPIIEEGYDLVIGSRSLGEIESGSMTPAQLFGNWLATNLIRWIYNYSFTDLGPFRAIRYDRLREMNMSDRNYGWTVEMQIKAAKLGMKSTEVAVPYRRRIGQSKISGTVKGTIFAGHKILWTIFKHI